MLRISFNHVKLIEGDTLWRKLHPGIDEETLEIRAAACDQLRVNCILVDTGKVLHRGWHDGMARRRLCCTNGLKGFIW